MKSVISRVGLALGLLTLVASVAVAAPGKKDKKAAPALCSACKMALSAKKDKAHPTAVKMGDKTMYCCAKCPMGKKPAKK